VRRREAPRARSYEASRGNSRPGEAGGGQERRSDRFRRRRRFGRPAFVGIFLGAAVLAAAIIGLDRAGRKPNGATAVRRTAPADGPSLPQIENAAALSAGYLVRACASTGRFAYRVDTGSGVALRSYNVVRHAGAIYALAVWNRSHPDRAAVDAMARAAAFLRANYLGAGADGRSDTLAIWSRPGASTSEASLGAAGLGLVAMTATEQARPRSVPLAEMQGLGRFLAFLEKSDGSFYSRYRAESGADGDWQSLYYPGEAALGLVSLYELDHSPQWLTAAGRALSYLARSRAAAGDLPADHWALIATARLLPYYARSGCPASRAELVAHAARICRSILRDRPTGPDGRLDGGFDPAGRTTPTATRLEGLLAALEFLPDDGSDLRPGIEAAVRSGAAFLLRAQIGAGAYAGGMPMAMPGGSAASARASDVRIDYVQHALCAWLGYEALLARSARPR